MSGDFLDSNVLLYLFAEADARRETATRVVGAAVCDGGATISYQVVQEVLNGMHRLANPPLAPADISFFLRETLMRLWRVMPSEALYERGISIRHRYGYSFYDSMIIAAALEAACTRLLSEDLQHGQRIDGLVIENPFR